LLRVDFAVKRLTILISRGIFWVYFRVMLSVLMLQDVITTQGRNCVFLQIHLLLLIAIMKMKSVREHFQIQSSIIINAGMSPGVHIEFNVQEDV